MDKRVPDVDQALADIGDGASIMVGGFGDSGFPFALVAGLQRKAPRDLTLIHNGAAFGSLVIDGCIKRLICSYPVGPSSLAILPALEAGSTELEVIPQGTLIERIRAGGAGLGGVLTPTGLGTVVEEGKQKLCVNGQPYLLETALHADYALVHALICDYLGNLAYALTARNFNPLMATAVDTVIVYADHVVPVGVIAPDNVVTPAPLVDYVIAKE